MAGSACRSSDSGGVGRYCHCLTGSSYTTGVANVVVAIWFEFMR
jgi:hypothetical protein